MNREIIDWADKELSVHENDLIKINDGLASTLASISQEELNKRKYYKCIPRVASYVEEVKRVKKLEESKPFYQFFKDYTKEMDNVIYSKINVARELDQIHKCAKCVCKNCILDCPFNSCFECNYSEYVFSCNKNNMCIIKGMPNIFQHDNIADRDLELIVLGRLINLTTKKQYILTAEVNNPSNSHLHEYVKHVTGEFELIQLTQEQLDEVYNEFEKLGCSDS